jgi:transcription initiation factor IIF auxiliary subunit
MEKLADGLQRLGEDDLLQVVQMVHEHKTNDTYTKNDVESELLNRSQKKGTPAQSED